MVTEEKTNGKVMEGEVYYPSEEVIAQANLKDWEGTADRAAKDPQGFWAAEAEELEWFQKWDKVLDDSKKPFFKWFTGAKTNIVHNAIDRHLKTYRKNKLALIWESEDGKLHQTYSYYAMNREVSRMANIIKAMGVQKGDRVTIYMGRVPEIVFAMAPVETRSREMARTGPKSLENDSRMIEPPAGVVPVDRGDDEAHHIHYGRPRDG